MKKYYIKKFTTYFTTFEREKIRSYDDICECLPKTGIPKMLVNTSYNGI